MGGDCGFDGGIELVMNSLLLVYRIVLMNADSANGKAKARGAYKGRKPSIDSIEVFRLKCKGMGASAIAKELGIGRASVYRLLAVSR